MHRALFVDRDGVINLDNKYVYKSEDFIFVEGIFDILKVFQEKGFIIIVVTNQAGIGRGLFTEDDFRKLTSWMLARFEEKGIYIKDVFFNPYHPKYGIGKYKKESQDRKPNPGMLFKAKAKYKIDMNTSYLIGDKISDIVAGTRAGIGGLFLLKSEQYPTTLRTDLNYFVIDRLMDIPQCLDLDKILL